jgi:hypothetical protein
LSKGKRVIAREYRVWGIGVLNVNYSILIGISEGMYSKIFGLLEVMH